MGLGNVCCYISLLPGIRLWVVLCSRQQRYSNLGTDRLKEFRCLLPTVVREYRRRDIKIGYPVVEEYGCDFNSNCWSRLNRHCLFQKAVHYHEDKLFSGYIGNGSNMCMLTYSRGSEDWNRRGLRCFYCFGGFEQTNDNPRLLSRRRTPCAARRNRGASFRTHAVPIGGL